MLKSSRLVVVSFAALLTAACGGGGGGASLGEGAPVPSPTPTPAPAPVPTPTPTPQVTEGSHTLGVNLARPKYWNFERSFMNLTMGGVWSLVTSAGWVPMDASRIDSSGSVKSLASNEQAAIVLAYPQPSSSGKTFRCTYTGTGAIHVDGESVSQIQTGDHKIEFKWILNYPQPDYAWLQISSTSASDPIRNIDCREADASPTQLFSTEFLDSLRPFGMLRFIDWEDAIQNTGGDWSKRTLPTAMTIGPDGVAVEHMVELLKELNADGYFCIPWNADDEYVTKFAQYVHDNMPANRTVYVEVSDEIWNGFAAGVQAQQEGIAQNLDSDPFTARMKRYGQKVNSVMRIWTQVYADRPSKLVRIAASQAVNFGVSDSALSFTDPNLIDALAIAPYFGYDLFDNGANQNASIDDLMLQLATKADESIDTMKRLKDHVAKYGKRMITYEAGQHVVTSNIPLAQSIERDPRMYDIYKRYIQRWHDELGDLMTLYSATTPISQYGSWGIREYNEQPLSETPKRRAAVEAALAQAAAAKAGQ